MKVDLLLVCHPNGDWFTLYVNGDRVTEGHSVGSNEVQDVLKHLGHQVNSAWRELPEELAEQYDGDVLPNKLSDLHL